MGLYLAVDAGGTKTECLIADDHRVLARRSTGTVKLMRVAQQVATERLQDLLIDTAAAAAVPLGQVTRSCVGLAGLSSASVRQWAERTMASTVAGDVLLCGDEEIALDGAFPGGSGILVIAGTGSNVIARAANGTLFGAGGWGPVLGDEGSGYWIGNQALRAALHARDRGIPTRLLDEIQRFWKLDSLGDLIAHGNRQPIPDFAELAPIVARCADNADALANRILEQAGEELAQQVAVAFGKMQASEPNVSGPIGIAYTGSVLTHISQVRAAMTTHLNTLVPQAHVLASPVDSLEGALWRARHAS